MHIPSSMLHGAVCPVTAAVSGITITGAAYAALKSQNKPDAARFGTVAALIFAGQMMNFPVQQGTSGHLLGGVLASALLGTPFGVLAVALVLAVQCLLFGDGGVSALGANILNMAVIGAGLGGLLYNALGKRTSGSDSVGPVRLAFAAWFSVVLASVACSAELAAAGTIALARGLGAMAGIHALIGIGEAAITVGAVLLVTALDRGKARRRGIGLPLSLSVAGVLLSPFASRFPDGLEWVAQRLHFIGSDSAAYAGLLPDYAFPLTGHPVASMALAGLAGVALTFFAAWIAGRVLLRHSPLIIRRDQA